MAEPTLVDYQQSTWTDTSSGTETTPSFTWLTGDVFHILGCTEDASVTLNLPTATGLTFTEITAVTGASRTRAYYWRATAASGGSGAISATTGDGTGSARGISVFQYRNTDGAGTPQTITGSSAKVISVTRGQANSHIILAMGDWNNVGDVTVDPSPAGGTQRVAASVAGRADFFVFSWGDQGATGTTNYGITNHTGTVDMTGIAVEILGTAGGGGSSILRQMIQQHGG